MQKRPYLIASTLLSLALSPAFAEPTMTPKRNPKLTP